MIIELRGVEFVNKGAELMLYSILDKIKERYPNAIVSTPTGSRSPIKKHRHLGLYSRLESKRHKALVHLINYYIPTRLLNLIGFIKEEQIDIVLDASGFAYGDQWGSEKAKKRISNSLQIFKEKNTILILLPQAFGPFKNKDLIDEMKKILTYADAVYARDRVSFDNLLSIYDDNNDKIQLKPDFTNLVAGKNNTNTLEHYDALIIPNCKMLTHTDTEISKEYINFLKVAILKFKDNGYTPYFLIHEGKDDINIAQSVNSMIDDKIDIIIRENPLVVKDIIGKSSIVLTSRFHGLVSALSQGIPCITTQWSHKYEMLLEDYNYKYGLCSVLDIDELKRKIDTLSSKEEQDRVKYLLKINSIKQKISSTNMWSDIYGIIDNKFGQNLK